MAQQICMRKLNLFSSANKESHILITSGRGNSCERRSVNHLVPSEKENNKNCKYNKSIRNKDIRIILTSRYTIIYLKL